MLTLKSSLTFNEARALIYTCNQKAPVVYFNSPLQNTEQMAEIINQNLDLNFHLVILYGMNWDDALTPWPMGPTEPGDKPCKGLADQYLSFLEQKILPAVEKEIEITERILAGYSLSGLFAIYAQYKTGSFAKSASMSGSLWYPGFVDYVKSHEFVKMPQAIFLSLGRDECKTRNPYFRNVLRDTDAIYEYYQSLGITTTLIMEPGNHFYEVLPRIIRGLQWILTN